MKKAFVKMVLTEEDKNSCVIVSYCHCSCKANRAKINIMFLDKEVEIHNRDHHGREDTEVEVGNEKLEVVPGHLHHLDYTTQPLLRTKFNLNIQVTKPDDCNLG